MTFIEWKTRADALTDAEVAEFRRRICVSPGHIGTCAIGRCSRCGGSTASTSMQICERCATGLGVCPFDQRMTGWGSVSSSDSEKIAARWLALLMRGYGAERKAARKALEGFALPGLSAAVRELERQPGTATRSPARAEFIVGFLGRVPEGLAEGAEFLNGTVVKVNAALTYAVVQTADAASFEELAAKHSQVRYVELNASPDNPPWE
ncbi:MAG: hypothetical protein AB1631_15665 [Acidobacteriota bacterium]